MKQKIITALLAISVISVANAEVYKITTFTKAQKKKVETELSEGSGDSIAFSTNKGPLWVYILNLQQQKYYPNQKLENAIM